MPYRYGLPDGRSDEDVLKREIAPRIKAMPDVPFVLHVGDVGRPVFACTDAWLHETLDFWRDDLAKPVFYTPGDNEWKDCDSPRKTERPVSALGRLEALRNLFFSPARLAGYAPEWQVQQQTDQPENLTWRYRGVRYVTQHVIGKDNGRKDALRDDPVEAEHQAAQRDSRNRAWLDRAFDLAAHADTQVLVIALQYDLFGPPRGEESDLERCLSKPAYREFCQHLQAAAGRLGKPVLLVSGDTNPFCLRQPFSREVAPMLWHLNAPGDYKVIDAAVVDVEPDNRKHPFRVTTLLSGAQAPGECEYAR